MISKKIICFYIIFNRSTILGSMLYWVYTLWDAFFSWQCKFCFNHINSKLSIMPACHLIKVVKSRYALEALYKSCAGRCREEQYRIDCEYLAYFLPKKFNNIQCFFAHENMKKWPQKLLIIGPNFFSVLLTGPKSAQNQPESHILFHKNDSLCNL